jgi:pheromone shutdown protein TraB
MSDTRVNLQFGNKEIILIGTAHVSRESINEVKTVIVNESPDMVCVELDAGRYNALTKKDNWEKLDVIKVFREGKGFFLIANLILASFQRRLGDELGVKPGEEMKVAIETAEEAGIPYSFCDREIQLTLRRAWGKCGFISKSKLLAVLLSSAFSNEKLDETQIEDLKKTNELDGMMSELSGYLPEVKEALIDERDRYLAAKIWLASGENGVAKKNEALNAEATSNESGAARTTRKTIAVVGAGHLHGLAAHLEKIAGGEETSEVADIEAIPKGGIGGKIAGWIIPAIIVALIVLGFFRAGTGVSLDMLLHWVLWNGSLAAVGTVAALGHPLAVIVAFFGAPIATLNPFIGVGLFTGIVQAVIYRPRVSDAEQISSDVTSIKGIYKNRISHALLVFFLSSIGGMIGNFISIPNIAGLLMR